MSGIGPFLSCLSREVALKKRLRNKVVCLIEARGNNILRPQHYFAAIHSVRLSEREGGVTDGSSTLVVGPLSSSNL